MKCGPFVLLELWFIITFVFKCTTKNFKLVLNLRNEWKIKSSHLKLEIIIIQQSKHIDYFSVYNFNMICLTVTLIFPHMFAQQISVQNKVI